MGKAAAVVASRGSGGVGEQGDARDPGVAGQAGLFGKAIDRPAADPGERRDRLVDRLEVLQADQPVRVADDPRAEAVQVRVRALLVELEVACRVERDGADSAPVAPDPERDRLGHGAARQQQGSGRAEQVAHLLLDLGDQPAGAVAVGVTSARGFLGERGQRLPRRRPAVPVKPPRASRRDRVQPRRHDQAATSSGSPARDGRTASGTTSSSGTGH